MREFQEESGLTETDYQIINNNILEEIFLGTNNIRYKHIYYLAECNKLENELLVDKNNFIQVSEVSNIRWFNFQEALDNIRPYNQEKKDILKKAYKLITEIKTI
jgi:NADH pyrophosphatase NudC (nudix superfamily)